MAKFVIINKDKPDIIVKGFSCKIGKLCYTVLELTDVLYHNGINTYPEKGDVIYRIDINNKYEVFTNNAACFDLTNKYITTDYKGVCNIINCKNKDGNVYDNN